MFKPHPGIKIHRKAGKGTRKFILWSVGPYLDRFGERDPEENPKSRFDAPEIDWLRPEQKLVIARDLISWIKGAACVQTTAYFQQQMFRYLIRQGAGQAAAAIVTDGDKPTKKTKDATALLDGLLKELPDQVPAPTNLIEQLDFLRDTVASYPDMGGKDHIMRPVDVAEFMEAALYLDVVDRAAEIITIYRQIYDAQNWIAARFLEPEEVNQFFRGSEEE